MTIAHQNQICQFWQERAAKLDLKPGRVKYQDALLNFLVGLAAHEQILGANKDEEFMSWLNMQMVMTSVRNNWTLKPWDPVPSQSLDHPVPAQSLDTNLALV